MSASTVTLTTDFGSTGWYVAAMKGVALTINPDLNFVDVSHDVPAQDIAHGAFVLGAACQYFDRDTVHVGIVDPGVGTARQAILVVTPSGKYLAPDNGLLTYVIASQGGGPAPERADDRADFMDPIQKSVPAGCQAYALNKPEFWRHPVSRTFHGRDLFAPVAGHVTLGVDPSELGDPIAEVVCLNVPFPEERHGVLNGRVVFLDDFGNLVTNIPASRLTGEDLSVEVGERSIQGLTRTFADAEGLMALVGSFGYLEVAESNANAARSLGVGIGARVRVVQER